MITDIIGQKKNNEAVRTFLNQFGDPSDSDTFGSFYILSYLDHGLSFYSDQNDIIVTAFLYSEGHDDFSEYKLELPNGILFSDARIEVHKKLGEPEISREKFDRYDFGSHLVHFQYSDSGSINMITIMDPLMKTFGEK